MCIFFNTLVWVVCCQGGGGAWAYFFYFTFHLFFYFFYFQFLFFIFHFFVEVVLNGSVWVVCQVGTLEWCGLCESVCECVKVSEVWKIGYASVWIV